MYLDLDMDMDMDMDVDVDVDVDTYMDMDTGTGVDTDIMACMLHEPFAHAVRSPSECAGQSPPLV